MKLTKPQTKLHDDALALLSLTRSLTEDEIFFVLDNYNPGATNNVGKNAIFFTPGTLAADVALCAEMSDGGRYLDLCSGIGRLTWELMQKHRYDSLDVKKKTTYVGVEANYEFVEIAKKLMPNAEWICGNGLNRDRMKELGTFTRGISNPPFGNIPTKVYGDWTRYTGVIDLMLAEVLVRLCDYGAVMILPLGSIPFDPKTHADSKFKPPQKWLDANPEYEIGDSRPTVDCDYYKKDWQNVSPNVGVVEVRYKEGLEKYEAEGL